MGSPIQILSSVCSFRCICAFLSIFFTDSEDLPFVLVYSSFSFTHTHTCTYIYTFLFFWCRIFRCFLLGYCFVFLDMLSCMVSESDVPRELFKNMNSLAQPTLSQLESPEMGPSTSLKKKTKNLPGGSWCLPLLRDNYYNEDMVQKQWSAVGELDLVHEVVEDFIEKEITFHLFFKCIPIL